MKKLTIILSIGLLTLASCNKVKDWKCTVDTAKADEDFDGKGTDVNFRGTKEEMETYEANGTKDFSAGGEDYKMITTCK